MHARSLRLLLLRSSMTAWALGASAALAIAQGGYLGTEGPSSGTVLATPGVVAGQNVTTSLSDANVDIILHRGLAGTLNASVRATFYMDTPAVPAPAPLLLVAFPVTGLYRGSVRIEDFKVVVDRTEPPTIFRRLLRYPTKLLDAPVHGTWPSQLAPQLDPNGNPVLTTFADGTQFFDSYLWTQPTNPGKQTAVVITYSVILEPESLVYSKKMGAHDPDVVPYDLMWAGDASHKAYFFDWILRPGATWKGFVGHETISLMADRDLGLNFGAGQGVIVLGRKTVPFDSGDHSDAFEAYRKGTLPDHVARQDDEISWTINHEKPNEDILIEIPATAIKPPPKPGSP